MQISVAIRQIDKGFPAKAPRLGRVRPRLIRLRRALGQPTEDYSAWAAHAAPRLGYSSRWATHVLCVYGPWERMGQFSCTGPFRFIEKFLI